MEGCGGSVGGIVVGWGGERVRLSRGGVGAKCAVAMMVGMRVAEHVFLCSLVWGGVV